MLRKCTDCGLEAHTNEQLKSFVKSNPANHKHGRRPLCNECNNKRRQQKRHKKRVEAILKKGGKCLHCGIEYNTKNSAIFDFHHIEPETKFRSGGFDMATLTKEKYFDEIDKCVLLCANCHRLEHSDFTY
jgi:hypothetical protein